MLPGFPTGRVCQMGSCYEADLPAEGQAPIKKIRGEAAAQPLTAGTSSSLSLQGEHSCGGRLQALKFKSLSNSSRALRQQRFRCAHPVPATVPGASTEPCPRRTKRFGLMDLITASQALYPHEVVTKTTHFLFVHCQFRGFAYRRRSINMAWNPGVLFLRG